MAEEIRTGDTVHHRPSGEEWLVAYVEDDRLAMCGWPPGEALVADCDLIKSCTDDECLELLHRMAKMEEPDKRGRKAREVLALVDREVITELARAVLTG